MKFVSFNINGIRARPHQMAAMVEKLQPDVIGLQEIKVVDEMFPFDLPKQLGYQACIHGQKGHYGVALFSRQQPLEWHRGLPDDEPEEQKRLIRARYETPSGPVWVINGYFPQGESRTHPVKFPYKQRFYRRLTEFLKTEHHPDEPLILMGDLNVSPQDVDIGIGEANRQRWLKTGKCSFLPEEREMLEELVSWGLVDTWRAQNPDRSDRYSWFDYRSKGFDDDPKRGLRIDQIWASSSLQKRLLETGIDYDIRAMEKPSDHCPIWARFDL
ncbi:MAG: exodeoxyribonuclease III [Gammaproteobacteria bacterium]